MAFSQFYQIKQKSILQGVSQVSEVVEKSLNSLTPGKDREIRQKVGKMRENFFEDSSL